MGTFQNKLAPKIKTAKDALPFATQYREPAKITGATLVNDDDGDLNKDGDNESEGCHVLKGPGPLSFMYEKGKRAGLAPAFRALGWKGDAPKTVKVDGKDVPAAAAVVDGTLMVQLLGTISAGKARIEIGNRTAFTGRTDVKHVICAVVVLLILCASAQAGEKIVIGGKGAWTAVRLVGYNPYGNKKSFYATLLKYKDWGRINVHSKGSERRKGAEEGTALIRFDLAKLPEGAKVSEAKLVFPMQRSAGKKNAVQVFRVLVPWTDAVTWKATDGETPWQIEGVHGEKDKKQVAAFDVPNAKYDPKAPKELSCDVTGLVKTWAADRSSNHGIKLEMTGGYVNIAMKGFRLEITRE